MLGLEAEVTATDQMRDQFLPMTAQRSHQRTKYFFGARYLWKEEQLDEMFSNVAGGIRVDVSGPPAWMKEKLEKPLVDAKVAPANFFNSYALNIYHNGSEGLAQHVDDAIRFK